MPTSITSSGITFDDATTQTTSATKAGGIGTTQLANDSVTNDKLFLAANAGEIKKALNADNAPPIFACRAWVNFDGTRNEGDTGASTNGANVKIRASGNVASVLKNAGGDYTVTFTTAMPDANYAAVTAGSWANASGCLAINHSTAPTASAVRLIHGHFAGNGATGYPSDTTYGMVSIVR
jgi:hypothetical protein